MLLKDHIADNNIIHDLFVFRNNRRDNIWFHSPAVIMNNLFPSKPH